MTSDNDQLHSGSAFPNTSWGLVLAARNDDGRRDALGSLCRRYWTPIYASVRRQGFNRADAEDLTQGFFLHIVERGTVGRADPMRGRFRGFLMGALRGFLASDKERENARKRGGPGVLASVDIDAVESSLQSDADGAASLDVQFDRRWAHALVHNALDALRTEYIESGNGHIYETLQSCLDSRAEPPSYALLATQLARSESAAKVAVHRFRGRFRDVLRREVGCTVATAQEIEDELAYLREVLAAEPVVAGVQ